MVKQFSLSQRNSTELENHPIGQKFQALLALSILKIALQRDDTAVTTVSVILYFVTLAATYRSIMYECVIGAYF